MAPKLTITTLYNAVKDCQLKAAEESIKQYGIPKGTKKTTDYLVLQMALEKNHKYIAKLLIDAGCRITPNDNEKDSGWTPLAWAIIRGNLETAMLLLNKHVSSEAGNKTGLTAVHLAVRKKSLDMLRLLLCHMSVNLVDSRGQSVLQTFFQVVCNQVNPDHLDLANNEKILELLLTKGANLDFRNDAFGYKALHYVVKSRQAGLINKIIQKTNNVNVVSNKGDTPLHVLLSEKNGYKQNVLDTVKLLVRHGANVNSMNNQNETLLHVVLSRHRANEGEIIEMIQFLVEKGANVNLQNFRSESASHMAAKKKSLRVLRLFLQHQCQINLQDYEDNTVFHRILQNSVSFRLDDAYIEIVNAILEMGPALAVRNGEGNTPLDLIIHNKQFRLLGRLLAENINVNAIDEKGNAVLHKFFIDLKEKNCKVDQDHVALVEILSSNRANVDLANNTNQTPVQLALDLLKHQCDRRANILDMLRHMMNHSNNLDNAIEEKSRAILHVMSQLKRPFEDSEDVKAAEIVDVCLRRGATIDLGDDGQVTPLCMAVINKQQHVVRVLLEHGADPNTPIPLSQVTVLEYVLKMKEHSEVDVEIAGSLLSHGAVVDESFGSEFSLLRYVTLPNKFEMCSKLIANSRNVNVIDDLENTALHILLQSSSNVDGETEDKVCKLAVELVLKGDLINKKNKSGLTPLHLAVKLKLYSVTQKLLEHHADPTARDALGNCALHFLAVKPRIKPDVTKDLKMVKLLTKNGCEINRTNNCGETPLLTAVQHGCFNSVRALIKLKADVNSCANELKDLLAPLHVSAQHNHTRITEYLIKYGADVNPRKLDGKTPLHLAVIYDKSNIVEILLKNRADPNMKDRDGKTALSLACWHSKVDTVTKLLNGGADVNVIDNAGKNPLQLSQGVVQMEISRHVCKLAAANVFVLPEILAKANRVNDALYKEFENEVAKLREVQIDQHKSLADVLTMSECRLTTFKSNEDFQKHINAQNFHEQFPVYADLLKARCTRGTIRCDLLAMAKIYFRELIEIPLPDICCDLLFGHLTNGNLQDLVTAARLNNRSRKRRRADEEEEEDDDDDGDAPHPAKRSRRVSV